MSTPEQHRPPVYGCAAAAVRHAHAGDALEPAVVLHTFLPPGLDEQLREAPVRVDVHGDGRGSDTLTVRVLVDGQALSWQLPVTPFVAALPGQPGDEGRMVLLALVDGEPGADFWSTPVGCEALAAELQLPVADLVDALHGHLTRWLAEDLQVLLHDDAHDRAMDRSPAQTLASAVLAHYRGDLDAEQAGGRLVRALELAPEPFAAELTERTATALLAAVTSAGPGALAVVREETGPFETEVLRLLGDLPARVRQAEPGRQLEPVLASLLDAADRGEAARAAVAVTARLARAAYGGDLPEEEVLRRLGMVDDAALRRLARTWVELAIATGAPNAGDAAVAARVAAQLAGEGDPGRDWLRATAERVVELGREVAGRRQAVGELQRQLPTLGRSATPADLQETARRLLPVARLARSGGGGGPGSWLSVPSPLAVEGVVSAYLSGLDPERAVDLLGELLEEDVDGVDLLDGLVCATAALLAHLEGPDDPVLRQAQVAELVSGAPGGAHGSRWLLLTCLREAPEHDSAAADLRRFLPADPVDAERLAARAGRTGTLSAGLRCLETLAAVLGEPAGVPREELLQLVLPTALVDHGLLRGADWSAP